MHTPNADHYSDSFDKERDTQNTSRRKVLHQIGKLGFAVAAVPAALGLMAREAYGQELPQEVIDVLNFALTLEYLEAEFYNQGVSAEGLIPSETQDVFAEISDNENAHVALLESVLGDQAVEKPTFDFTAGGQFNPFEDYQTFLVLSQAFEDTGVRAYKGQAPNLINQDDLLTTALQIHSVEARHASEVRRIRGLPGWIPLDGAATETEAIQPVYQGEGETAQLGLQLTDVVSSDELVGDNVEEQVTESFDEPFSREEVLSIADPFIQDQEQQ